MCDVTRTSLVNKINKSVGPIFFSLLCLNNYSKIFQKRRIVKLLLGFTQVGYPLGGAPLGPLQGSPGVTEFWKKSQKLYKKLSCIKIPQITTLTSILGHLVSWGGPGGSKWFFGRARGFFGSESVHFFSKCLILVHYKVLGG